MILVIFKTCTLKHPIIPKGKNTQGNTIIKCQILRANSHNAPLGDSAVLRAAQVNLPTVLFASKICPLS